MTTRKSSAWKSQSMRRLVPGALLLFSCLVSITAAAGEPAQGKALNLANRPLFTGPSVPPNVMVAVDNSGSMDYEVLFPTNDGVLYWDENAKSFYVNRQYVSIENSDIPDLGKYQYNYLFPNGCNRYKNAGRRVYCSEDDEKKDDDNQHHAVPPLPQFAFTRSPDFNKSYFNPATLYKPWLGKPAADPTNAQYEPALSPGPTLDLTHIVKRTGKGYEFAMQPGMTIPPDIAYLHDETFGKTDDAFKPSEYGLYAIAYFPATFYLNPKDKLKLPDDYGYKSPTPEGIGAAGEELVRYEIRPKNFESDTQYQATIQNFANWFSYYRKRHLATRAGIVAAFDRINNVEAGSCTINQLDPLIMRDMDAESDAGERPQRKAFYQDIFDMNFWNGGGTPNRPALKFLGEQLENNASIITSPCQQNYAILFTDGYNNKTVSGIGNADDKSESNKKHGAPFGDKFSNTTADVAMKYYEHLGDLNNRKQQNLIARNEMRVPGVCSEDKPDPSIDCQDDLHMVTFGVTLGQKGVIFGQDKYKNQNNNPYNNPPDWPNPNGLRDSAQIDDLWHATINTRGKLLNARTPVELADTFSSALERILAQTGTASALAANSGNYKTDTLIYQASFTAGSWQGKLDAYKVGDALNDDDKSAWHAAKNLSDPGAWEKRVILTSIPEADDGETTYQPAAFTKTALKNVLPNLTKDLPGTSSSRLDYIRGDQSQERSNNGILRNRSGNVLGDIVHSSPVYVGPPSRLRYPDKGKWQNLMHDNASLPENTASTDYSNPASGNGFAQSKDTRPAMIYVGANDGMLHGFSAKDGEEKIAYLPGAVLSEVGDLTDPNYIHRFYVDGTPTEGDVVFDGKWHSVLVGGLRNGGRSIYALDITDPTSFSESIPGKTVLWEYSNDKLGKTYGTPSVIRLHSGKWAAMFSSGYRDDATRQNIDAPAGLFLVTIEDVTRTKRVDATYLGVSGRGLSMPFPVDIDGDFITDYAYAGDLDGNLWKFDLTAKDSEAWTATKLFIATDTDGKTQPITTQPQVGFHPYGRDYGLIIYFGTGKYLENSDNQLDIGVRNSFYGIWDPGETKDLSRDDLVKQSVINEQLAQGKQVRVVTNDPVNFQKRSNPGLPGNSSGSGEVYGWVLDLPDDTGERIVTGAQLRGGAVNFSTTIPSAESCTAGGGAYYMAVDSATGGRTGYPTFDLNDDNRFLTSGENRDTVTIKQGKDDVEVEVAVSGLAINQGIGAPGGALLLTDNKTKTTRGIIRQDDGTVTQVNMNPGLQPDGRISWREIRR